MRIKEGIKDLVSAIIKWESSRPIKVAEKNADELELGMFRSAKFNRYMKLSREYYEKIVNEENGREWASREFEDEDLLEEWSMNVAYCNNMVERFLGTNIKRQYREELKKHNDVLTLVELEQDYLIVKTLHERLENMKANESSREEDIAELEEEIYDIMQSADENLELETSDRLRTFFYQVDPIVAAKYEYMLEPYAELLDLYNERYQISQGRLLDQTDDSADLDEEAQLAQDELLREIDSKLEELENSKFPKDLTEKEANEKLKEINILIEQIMVYETLEEYKEKLKVYIDELNTKVNKLSNDSKKLIDEIIGNPSLAVQPRPLLKITVDLKQKIKLIVRAENCLACIYPEDVRNEYNARVMKEKDDVSKIAKDKLEALFEDSSKEDRILSQNDLRNLCDMLKVCRAILPTEIYEKFRTEYVGLVDKRSEQLKQDCYEKFLICFADCRGSQSLQDLDNKFELLKEKKVELDALKINTNIYKSLYEKMKLHREAMHKDYTDVTRSLDHLETKVEVLGDEFELDVANISNQINSSGILANDVESYRKRLSDLEEKRKKFLQNSRKDEEYKRLEKEFNDRLKLYEEAVKESYQSGQEGLEKIGELETNKLAFKKGDPLESFFGKVMQVYLDKEKELADIKNQLDTLRSKLSEAEKVVRKDSTDFEASRDSILKSLNNLNLPKLDRTQLYEELDQLAKERVKFKEEQANKKLCVEIETKLSEQNLDGLEALIAKVNDSEKQNEYNSALQTIKLELERNKKPEKQEKTVSEINKKIQELQNKLASGTCTFEEQQNVYLELTQLQTEFALALTKQWQQMQAFQNVTPSREEQPLSPKPLEVAALPEEEDGFEEAPAIYYDEHPQLQEEQANSESYTGIKLEVPEEDALLKEEQSKKIAAEAFENIIQRLNTATSMEDLWDIHQLMQNNKHLYTKEQYDYLRQKVEVAESQMNYGSYLHY